MNTKETRCCASAPESSRPSAHQTPLTSARAASPQAAGRWSGWIGLGMAVFSAALLTCGCQGPKYAEVKPADLKAAAASASLPSTNSTSASSSLPIILREGDIIKVSFPGAPNLNNTYQIRRDGKIDLSLVGECQAAGITLQALEKQILKLYEPQLQTKEVQVSLETSLFPIYVTGAVLRPGKVNADHPLTPLEAIMEAGGFDYRRANAKAVKVIREEKGNTHQYQLNLKRVMQGEASEPFTLQPSDIIFVPERFTWF